MENQGLEKSCFGCVVEVEAPALHKVIEERATTLFDYYEINNI